MRFVCANMHCKRGQRRKGVYVVSWDLPEKCWRMYNFYRTRKIKMYDIKLTLHTNGNSEALTDFAMSDAPYWLVTGLFFKTVHDLKVR